MKLDKIIDNDTYVKKEKELLSKIDEVSEKLNTYKSEIINKDKQIILQMHSFACSNIKIRIITSKQNEYKNAY